MAQTGRLSIWDTDRWLCNSVGELVTALEEFYQAEEPGAEAADEDVIEDCSNCPRLGDPLCSVDIGVCPAKRDRIARIYRQNREIRAALPYLTVKDIQGRTKHAALIRAYYLCIPPDRRLPRHMERRGWVEVARMLGVTIPRCSGGVRCREGDDRIELPKCKWAACEGQHRDFEEARTGAIRALYRVLQVR